MTKKKLKIGMKNRVAECQTASARPHTRMRVKAGFRSFETERRLAQKLRTSHNFDCRMSYWQMVAVRPALFDAKAGLNEKKGADVQRHIWQALGSVEMEFFLKQFIAYPGGKPESQCGRQMLYAMENGYPVMYRCDTPQSSIRLTSRGIASKDCPGEEAVYNKWNIVIAQNAFGLKELFYTPNLFWGKNRSIETLHTLRACWVDLDREKGLYDGICRGKVWGLILARMKHDGLPLPFVVDSGSGFHFVWPIEHEDKSRLQDWNSVQQALLDYIEEILEYEDELAGWEPDRRAVDAARMLRMPSSYNKNAKKTCVIETTTERTTLDELMEHFAIKPYVPVKKGEKQKKRTSYVASSRIRALMGWLHGRQGDIQGYRNTFLNIILSTIQTSRGDGCDLLAEAMAINSQFAEPLRKSEVAACARACQKTAYRWKNDTIMERLSMTAEESRVFIRVGKSTIKPTHAYYLAQATGKDTRISNRTRKCKAAERRNEKEKLYMECARLHKAGKSAKKISEILGIPLSTVYYYRKNAEKILSSRRRARLARKHIRIRKSVRSRRASFLRKLGRISGCLRANDNISYLMRAPKPVTEPGFPALKPARGNDDIGHGAGALTHIETLKKAE